MSKYKIKTFYGETDDHLMHNVNKHCEYVWKIIKVLEYRNSRTFEISTDPTKKFIIIKLLIKQI